MKIKNLLLLNILALSILMTGCITKSINGKTVHETFPDKSVADFLAAVGKGNYNEADRLVKAGTDVNAISEEGISPLLWIMGNTVNARKIEYLLNVGANPNYRDSATQASAMFLAAGGNRLDILEILLKKQR